MKLDEELAMLLFAGVGASMIALSLNELIR
jgi:hypothetical protein